MIPMIQKYPILPNINDEDMDGMQYPVRNLDYYTWESARGYLNYQTFTIEIDCRINVRKLREIVPLPFLVRVRVNLAGGRVLVG